MVSSPTIDGVIEAFREAWLSGNADAAADAFAPDGVLVSPTGAWRGHEAIREAAASFFAEADLLDVVVTRVVSTGSVGAIEWTWTERRKSDGSVAVIEDAIVYELGADGVRYWREYFDPAQTELLPGVGAG